MCFLALCSLRSMPRSIPLPHAHSRTFTPTAPVRLSRPVSSFHARPVLFFFFFSSSSSSSLTFSTTPLLLHLSKNKQTKKKKGAQRSVTHRPPFKLLVSFLGPCMHSLLMSTCSFFFLFLFFLFFLYKGLNGHPEKSTRIDAPPPSPHTHKSTQSTRSTQTNK